MLSVIRDGRSPAGRQWQVREHFGKDGPRGWHWRLGAYGTEREARDGMRAIKRGRKRRQGLTP